MTTTPIEKVTPVTTSADQRAVASAKPVTSARTAATKTAPAQPSAAKPVARKTAPLVPSKSVIAKAVKPAQPVPLSPAVVPKVPKVAAKKETSPVAKSTATPTAKSTAKTDAKAAPKPAAKPLVKAVDKSSSKTGLQTSGQRPSSVAESLAVKPKVSKKAKLVRDSFTIPKNEFVVLDDLKLRAAALMVAVKKSELLRAGIKALAAMPEAKFLAALKEVPAIKTGRPASNK